MDSPGQVDDKENDFSERNKHQTTDFFGQSPPPSVTDLYNGDGDGDQPVNEVNDGEEEVAGKEEDESKTEVMDALTEPAANKGDCQTVGDTVDFDMSMPSCSKAKPIIKKIRKASMLITRRIDLPRRSKTRAYERLRRITSGFALTRIRLQINSKKRKPKRLKSRRAAKRKTQTSYDALRSSRRRVKRNPRSKFTRARMMKQDSSTTIQSSRYAASCNCRECQGFSLYNRRSR